MHVRELNSEEQLGLDTERAWLNDLLAGVGSDARLTGTQADIPTLHSLLANGPYSPDAASELIIMGTALGDVLASAVGLRWVVVEDTAGTDIALQYQNKHVFVFARDMLIKRVESGQHANEINLEVLLSEVRTAVAEEATKARAAT